MIDSSFKERNYFLTITQDYIDSEKYGKALELAQQRLAAKPGDIDAKLVIVSCLVKMDNLSDASVILKELEGTIQEWSRVYEVFGDVYQKQGNAEEAIRSYKKISVFNPDAASAQRISDKIAFLEKTTVLDDRLEEQESQDVDLEKSFQTMTLVDLYMKQGYTEKARQILKDILNQDPYNTEARKKLSDLDAFRKANTPVIKELERWLQKVTRTS